LAERIAEPVGKSPIRSPVEWADSRKAGVDGALWKRPAARGLQLFSKRNVMVV
jgi:hypothetical protein